MFLHIQKCLNLLARYYQNNKERLNKKLMKYRRFSQEEKEKKQQYGCEQYRYLAEDEKKSFLNIEKNISKWEKTSN